MTQSLRVLCAIAVAALPLHAQSGGSADMTVRIADRDDRIEAKTATAFDDLRHAIDRDELVLKI